jgi:hypothetical protein
MVNKVLDYIVTNFGFKNNNDFLDSIIHLKMIPLTVSLAGISSIIELIIGLRFLTIIAFTILITLELFTGIIASKLRGEKIESYKFSRFGLKLLVWMLLLYTLNTFRIEFSLSSNNMGNLAESLFIWLHGTLFIYITIEYLISVLENLGSISGKEKKTLINSIIKKFNSFLENDKKSNENI